MLKQLKIDLKKRLLKARSYLIARAGKWFMTLLIKTCRIEVEGMERFNQLVQTEKCILILWHNRLAIVPYILSHHTPQNDYAALVSGSRDGDILRFWVHSYKNGKTIRAPHQGRYEALREIVRKVEERKMTVVITPDGPRGPLYELKPGIAVAALETKANIVCLNWEATAYWELKTWDRLRLPKPFTTIRVKFQPPLTLNQSPPPSLEEAKAILKQYLSV